MKRLHLRIFFVGLIASLASSVGAQEVGTIAAADGTAEVGRVGVWSAANIGDPVKMGDTLRTGSPGGLRVVFQDDSVLNVGPDSQILVDQQTFEPDTGTTQSLFKMLRGRVRTLVSEYYDRKGASYEIETPTAVAGVRGTEFVVSYNPDDEVTEVVGVSGRVEVHSVLDRATRGVYITAGELTTIAKGEFPALPPRLEEDTFRQYLEGLEFIGTGRPESMTVNHPLLGGVEVPEPDRAPAPAYVETVTRDRVDRDASSLVDQPPSVIQAETGDLSVRF